MKHGKTAKEVYIDLKLSYLKPKHTRWVLSAFDKLKNNTDVFKAGWEKTGITASIAAARGYTGTKTVANHKTSVLFRTTYPCKKKWLGSFHCLVRDIT